MVYYIIALSGHHIEIREIFEISIRFCLDDFRAFSFFDYMVYYIIALSGVLRSFKWNFFFELRRDAVVEHDLFYIVSTRDSVRTSQFDVP
eukprot:CAMPEP_0168356302 /NCGR_PEP_ID=MMETSP0213-20121227/25071_1 /TAXON_ID=151035 /ORGANISM="Euplotes harpa, Strain FSP1.4" /LENGTH=89 /DNA_ID=CAMNT_0008368689 /DNA_START=405 /DNA_END=671 /DNA_ORIENTATION=+